MTNETTANTKLEDLKNILDATVICREDLLPIEINSVSASDLMSDVLTFVNEGSLLLTGLTNMQVVRTAEMAGIAAVCFVREKMPPEETIALAKEKNVPLLATKLSMYEACGRLHKRGLHGYDEIK
jgi:predicted transcriptional regulator